MHMVDSLLSYIFSTNLISKAKRRQQNRPLVPYNESITILQHENGTWEIVVITDEAYQNGTAMYDILNAGLLSLHVINLAVCVVWYLVKTKKRKTA